ncbi:MAG: hypothetical protein EBS05_23715 [Proteobacteria bacterium]|nr:hypothetical protein [Pseudomonadota bacterium]
MSNLHEKAVLVKLTSHKPTLLRRSDDKTAQLQQVTDDKGAAAYVKLFSFKTPVQEALARHRDVIRLHQRLTLPYEDRGPRLLPNARYLDYTTQMRAAMDRVAEWFDQHRAHYPTYVGADCASRGWKVQPDEYPTIEQFEAALSHDLEFTPMPQLTHFLFDLSPADRASFEQRQQLVVERAIEDALRRVCKPLDALLDKLQTYAAQPGQRFKDTLLVNLTKGISDMDALLLQDVPPSVRASVDGLSATIHALLVDPAALRESAEIRAAFTNQLASTRRILTAATPTTPTLDTLVLA